MFRITLKNYRCFADSSPAVIEIDSGFTAFVGANNSGKSSCLKFFHEFHDLFIRLKVFQTEDYMFSPRSVEDWIELFNNDNNRNLTIEIHSGKAGPQEIEKIVILIERAKPNFAKLTSWLKLENGNVVEVKRHTAEDHYLFGRQIFQGDFSKFVLFFSTLEKALYVGPFRNAINQGAGDYFDLVIGTTFVEHWGQWKTGRNRSENVAVQQVADDIAHIFDFVRFEINATSDRNTLQVIINGKPYRLRELGAGLAQFIIVLGNVAIKRPSLLLIDEPELNLHPSLQIDFLTSLASYSSYGIIFASHSIGLARSVSDRVYTFQKIKTGTKVRLFEHTSNFAEFAGEMSFSSFKELGHDRVLLVEGVTEVKTIQQFLRTLRKDHTTVLLPLGGGQLIRRGVQQELSELGRLSRNVSVLIDSERESADQPLSEERERFAIDCRDLGFKVCVTKRRATENYFTDRAVKEEKGESYRALSEFEKLGKGTLGWAKTDNWRIARRMTVEDLLSTDIGLFLNEI